MFCPMLDLSFELFEKWGASNELPNDVISPSSNFLDLITGHTHWFLD